MLALLVLYLYRTSYKNAVLFFLTTNPTPQPQPQPTVELQTQRTTEPPTRAFDCKLFVSCFTHYLYSFSFRCCEFCSNPFLESLFWKSAELVMSFWRPERRLSSDRLGRVAKKIPLSNVQRSSCGDGRRTVNTVGKGFIKRRMACIWTPIVKTNIYIWYFFKRVGFLWRISPDEFLDDDGIEDDFPTMFPLLSAVGDQAMGSETPLANLPVSASVQTHPPPPPLCCGRQILQHCSFSWMNFDWDYLETSQLLWFRGIIPIFLNSLLRFSLLNSWSSSVSQSLPRKMHFGTLRVETECQFLAQDSFAECVWSSVLAIRVRKLSGSFLTSRRQQRYPGWWRYPMSFVCVGWIVLAQEDHLLPTSKSLENFLTMAFNSPSSSLWNPCHVPLVP